MRTLTIARNTFREAVFLPVVLIIAVGSVALVVIVGQLPRFTMSIYDDIRMLKDLTVATATLAGMLITIFTAVHVITGEIENWTVVTVLSKPVRRWEFVLGKYVGLVFVLVTMFVVLGVLYILAVWWGIWETVISNKGAYAELVRDFWKLAWGAANEMWRALLMCLMQVMVLGAVAVACCVRASMIVSVLIFFTTFVAGQFVERIAKASSDAGSSLGRFLGTAVAAVIPDLQILNFSQEVGGEKLISFTVMGWGGLYTCLYASAAIIVAVMLFRNREVL